MLAASCASTSRPDNMISNARDDPIARGNKKLRPSSVAVRPLLIPAARKYADSPAIRMSAPNVRHSPPPIAAPFTAQITGCGIRCMAGTRSARIDIARVAMRVSVSPSMFGGGSESAGVGAGTEPTSLAGEDHAGRVVVLGDTREGLVERHHQLEGHRVHPLGPVHGDHRGVRSRLVDPDQDRRSDRGSCDASPG